MPAGYYNKTGLPYKQGFKKGHGYIGGGPKKGFIPWNKGIKGLVGHKKSEQEKENLRLIHLGDKNHIWKGDNAGYGAIHDWVRKRKIKPEFCEECELVPPYDLANISGEYKRDINDFEYLCRRCHMLKDGRIKS